jgi:hypothetical protein
MRPEPQRRMQSERDLGLHVGELLLDQLIGGERPVELLAVEDVLPRAMPAEFRRAHRAPGDAVARHVEAAERTREAFDVRQQILLRHDRILQHDLAGDRGAQRSLPSIFGVEKPFVPRSTMKPRIAPSSFAHTTAMSAIGELVIHILAPLSA